MSDALSQSARGHDPVLPEDLLAHQLAALAEVGTPIPLLAGDTRQRLEQLEELVEFEDADAGEPSDPAAILSLARTRDSTLALDDGQLTDRVLGAWLGRCAGNSLGKPFELPSWTAAGLRQYLESYDAWPLLDYAPADDPVPSPWELREDSWRTTTRGRVSSVTRDDDLDYTVLNLLLLERHGLSFTTDDVGKLWLELLPFGKTFTAEAAAYRNLSEGRTPPETALRLNPYREWVGALIRADMFGLVNPGRPLAAAAAAAMDARLSHVRNGIYGEMWAAAAVASAFAPGGPREIVESALGVIPEASRLHAAVTHVVNLHADGSSWETAIEWIQALDYYYVHVINNAAIIAAALLWSEGDFSRGIGLAVSAAFDTDSNAATVGAILGANVGAAGIPTHWTRDFNDELHTALSGYAVLSITDLATRTVGLVRGVLSLDSATELARQRR